MTGWTRMWKPAASSPPPCWPTRCSNCAACGFGQFHFYTLNQANLSYAACRLLGFEPESIVMSFDRSARIAWMKKRRKKRLLLLDGSWGVMIQGYKLGEDDFRGAALRQSSQSDLQRQQRSSHPDQAGDHPRYRPRLSGRRRRFHRDQHLQFQFHQPGRLWPGPSGRRIERGGRPAGARTCATNTPPPTVRAWWRACWARPTAPPPSRPTSTIPPSATSPSTSCAPPIAIATEGLIKGGADVHHDRDHLRHPERQGGDLRHRGSVRRRWACACRCGFPAPSPTCRAAP